MNKLVNQKTSIAFNWSSVNLGNASYLKRWAAIGENMNRVMLAMLLSTAFIGCKNVCTSDIYQLVASTDGRVYRLNRNTGEVWSIDKDGIHPLGSNDIVIDRKELEAEIKRRGLKNE